MHYKRCEAEEELCRQAEEEFEDRQENPLSEYSTKELKQELKRRKFAKATSNRRG